MLDSLQNRCYFRDTICWKRFERLRKKNNLRGGYLIAEQIYMISIGFVKVVELLKAAVLKTVERMFREVGSYFPSIDLKG